MSRKISEEACEALLTGKPYKKSNTVVERLDNSNITWIMKLFGNPIAHCRPQSHFKSIKRVRTPEYLQICDGQHQSMTTKERLNALPNVSIHQENFQWYINDCKWENAYNNRCISPHANHLSNPYGWIDVIVDYEDVKFTYAKAPPAPAPSSYLTEDVYEELRKKYRI